MGSRSLHERLGGENVASRTLLCNMLLVARLQAIALGVSAMRLTANTKRKPPLLLNALIWLSLLCS
jgi:hypothetical protein